MLRIFISSVLLLISMGMAAQPKPAKKEKAPSASDMEQAMKEAQEMMKDLSPEQKKMMDDAMKMANPQAVKAAGVGATTAFKIPTKQTAILAKIPKIGSDAQYNSYISLLKTKASVNIPAATREKVDQLITKNQGNATVLNNLPPIFFLNKNPKAAVYAAIRVASLNSSMPGSQNNLAVILHQTGYPQYALPILEHLNTKRKNDPVLISNTAQCYLSLGEKEKAKLLFMTCLRIDANNAEANTAIALIHIAEGKTHEAVPYIHKAIKNGFSETLEKMISDKKIVLDYDKIKCNVPEYLNPQKYKPVPAATKLGEVKKTLAAREEMRLLMNAWQLKAKEANEGQDEKMQAAASSMYFVAATGFGRKAKFMLLQNQQAMADWYTKTVMDNYNIEVKAKENLEQLDKGIIKKHHTGNYSSEYEVCKMKEELVNEYLKTSAELHDNHERKTLHKTYEFTNQQLHWLRFLVSEPQYKAMFYSISADFFEKLNSYNKCQSLTTTADNVATHCIDILQNPPRKQEVTELPEGDCPYKIRIPLIIGSFKEDCKGMEIEGGELLVLGFEKDYRTGEFSLAFGLGASVDAELLGLGTKGQMFFKFANDYSPLDCGLKFEAGGEAILGPLVLEEKMTATIGMASGISVDAVDRGKTTNIFRLDPTQ